MIKALARQPHILIIDDDDRIRQLVTRYLQEQDFVVCGACDVPDAKKVMKNFLFDALVVDIMMPGETGLEFTQQLREEGDDIPVLFLTALGEAEDRIKGLETGGDDYLPKPFEPRELVLRIQSLLKRRPQVNVSAAKYRIGEWVYDPEHLELSGDGGGSVRLTTVENNLLSALASFAGQVVSREKLAGICEMDAGERTIDVQVTRLRRKIESDTKNPRFLQTVRGKGYLLRAEET